MTNHTDYKVIIELNQEKLKAAGIKYDDAVKRLNKWADFYMFEKIGDTAWQGKPGGANFQWFIEFNADIYRREADVAKCASAWWEFYPDPVEKNKIVKDDVLYAAMTKIWN